jgi:hypothetical protein
MFTGTAGDASQPDPRRLECREKFFGDERASLLRRVANYAAEKGFTRRATERRGREV